ncbi:7803_t:CDS:1 [Paraglomus occultum]|uniref:7803_t:CDS:1 n=1 Tax=Paraglomus occultum TaxID=144539 RepID=A0A9N9BPD3_9GLOM|nr:7803_t:CDS:1 [Paraglomus occultum]
MLDLTPDQWLQLLQEAWQHVVNSFNMTEVVQSLKTNISAVVADTDVVILIGVFLVLYIAFSVARYILGTVMKLARFALFLGLIVGIYWIYLSIDPAKGNEELRTTTKKVVQQVKGVMRDVVDEL